MPEDELIKLWEYELSEPPCAPGSGRFGLKILLGDDISAVFPYLNATMDETVYDVNNQILIGRVGKRLFALRRKEIQVSGIEETSQSPGVVKTAIELVNHVWRTRESIVPSFSERKIPTAIEIYSHLPKTNCRECGYVTCLVFAAELRQGKCGLKKCKLLNSPQHTANRESINRLLAKE